MSRANTPPGGGGPPLGDEGRHPIERVIAPATRPREALLSSTPAPATPAEVLARVGRRARGPVRAVALFIAGTGAIAGWNALAIWVLGLT